MKKVLSLCLILPLILLCSCGSESGANEASYRPLRGEWRVSVKNRDRTDGCTVYFEENGTVTLEYTDADSHLRGMVEKSDGQGVKVQYGEILSEKKGASLPSARLWRARTLIESGAEEARENDKILLTARSETEEIRLFMTKEEKTPLSLEISDRYGTLTLLFEGIGGNRTANVS